MLATEWRRRTIPESCNSMQSCAPLFVVQVVLMAALINWAVVYSVVGECALKLDPVAISGTLSLR
jgi:hypothetical protein